MTNKLLGALLVVGVLSLGLAFADYWDGRTHETQIERRVKALEGLTKSYQNSINANNAFMAQFLQIAMDRHGRPLPLSDEHRRIIEEEFKQWNLK